MGECWREDGGEYENDEEKGGWDVAERIVRLEIESGPLRSDLYLKTRPS